MYLGEDSTPDGDEFKREQSGVTFSPGRLAANTTYYWRADAKNAVGVTTGTVWKFTTKPAKPARVSGAIPADNAGGVNPGNDAEMAWCERCDDVPSVLW